MGGSRDEFGLYVSQPRGSSTAADDSFKLDRLELQYFPADGGPGVAPDMDDIVIFQVGEQSQHLQANKYALAAQSTVFKAQLFGQCVEAAGGVIHIQDFSITSFSFFLSLLTNTSTDNAYHAIHCAPKDVDLVEVCALADKYCAEAVRHIAEASVLQQVNEANIRGLVEQCRKYRARGLADRICDQIVARFPKESVAQLLKELVTKSIEDY